MSYLGYFTPSFVSKSTKLPGNPGGVVADPVSSSSSSSYLSLLGLPSLTNSLTNWSGERPVEYLRGRLLGFSHEENPVLQRNSRAAQPSPSPSSSSPACEEDARCTDEYVKELQNVSAFLHLYHPDHFRVFCLFPPRASYTTLEEIFPGEQLERCILDEGFDRPPGCGLVSLCDLVLTCTKIEEYLAQNPKNVAVLHCKSISGTAGAAVSFMAACYLKWTEEAQTLKDALLTLPVIKGRVLQQIERGMVGSTEARKFVDELILAGKPAHDWIDKQLLSGQRSYFRSFSFLADLLHRPEASAKKPPKPSADQGTRRAVSGQLADLLQQHRTGTTATNTGAASSQASASPLVSTPRGQPPAQPHPHLHSAFPPHAKQPSSASLSDLPGPEKDPFHEIQPTEPPLSLQLQERLGSHTAASSSSPQLGSKRESETLELLKGKAVMISRISVLGGIPQLFKAHRVQGHGLRGVQLSFMPSSAEEGGGYAGLNPFLMVYENGAPRWSGPCATAESSSDLAALFQISVVVRGDICVAIWRGEELYRAGALPSLCLPFHTGFVNSGVLRSTDVDLPEVIQSSLSVATLSPKTFAMDVFLESPRYDEEVLLLNWWPIAYSLDGARLPEDDEEEPVRVGLELDGADRVRLLLWEQRPMDLYVLGQVADRRTLLFDSADVQNRRALPGFEDSSALPTLLEDLADRLPYPFHLFGPLSLRYGPRDFITAQRERVRIAGDASCSLPGSVISFDCSNEWIKQALAKARGIPDSWAESLPPTRIAVGEQGPFSVSLGPLVYEGEEPIKDGGQIFLPPTEPGETTPVLQEDLEESAEEESAPALREEEATASPEEARTRSPSPDEEEASEPEPAPAPEPVKAASPEPPLPQSPPSRFGKDEREEEPEASAPCTEEDAAEPSVSERLPSPPLTLPAELSPSKSEGAPVEKREASLDIAFPPSVAPPEPVAKEEKPRRPDDDLDLTALLSSSLQPALTKPKAAEAASPAQPASMQAPPTNKELQEEEGAGELGWGGQDEFDLLSVGHVPTALVQTQDLALEPAKPSEPVEESEEQGWGDEVDLLGLFAPKSEKAQEKEKEEPPVQEASYISDSSAPPSRRVSETDEAPQSSTTAPSAPDAILTLLQKPSPEDAFERDVSLEPAGIPAAPSRSRSSSLQPKPEERTASSSLGINLGPSEPVVQEEAGPSSSQQQVQTDGGALFSPTFSFKASPSQTTAAPPLPVASASLLDLPMDDFFKSAPANGEGTAPTPSPGQVEPPSQSSTLISASDVLEGWSTEDFFSQPEEKVTAPLLLQPQEDSASRGLQALTPAPSLSPDERPSSSAALSGSPTPLSLAPSAPPLPRPSSSTPPPPPLPPGVKSRKSPGGSPSPSSPSAVGQPAASPARSPPPPPPLPPGVKPRSPGPQISSPSATPIGSAEPAKASPGPPPPPPLPPGFKKKAGPASPSPSPSMEASSSTPPAALKSPPPPPPLPPGKKSLLSPARTAEEGAPSPSPGASTPNKSGAPPPPPLPGKKGSASPSPVGTPRGAPASEPSSSAPSPGPGTPPPHPPLPGKKGGAASPLGALKSPPLPPALSVKGAKTPSPVAVKPEVIVNTPPPPPLIQPVTLPYAGPKLTPVYWQKLSDTSSAIGTVWEEINKEEARLITSAAPPEAEATPKKPLGEEEALKSTALDSVRLLGAFFSVKEKTETPQRPERPRPPQDGSRSGTPSRMQIVGARDPRRGMNLQLSLRAQEPWPAAAQLRSMLLSGDTNLTAEKLRALTFVSPKKEDPNEYALIDDFFRNGGRFEDLHFAEQVVVALSSLPDCDGMLNALLFVRSFDSLYLEVRQAADLVIEACRTIRNSSLLRHVLKVILRLGNALNTAASDKHRNAVGLTLSSSLNNLQKRALDEPMFHAVSTEGEGEDSVPGPSASESLEDWMKRCQIRLFFDYVAVVTLYERSLRLAEEKRLRGESPAPSPGPSAPSLPVLSGVSATFPPSPFRAQPWSASKNKREEERHEAFLLGSELKVLSVALREYGEKSPFSIVESEFSHVETVARPPVMKTIQPNVASPSPLKAPSPSSAPPKQGLLRSLTAPVNSVPLPSTPTPAAASPAPPPRPPPLPPSLMKKSPKVESASATASPAPDATTSSAGPTPPRSTGGPPPPPPLPPNSAGAGNNARRALILSPFKDVENKTDVLPGTPPSSSPLRSPAASSPAVSVASEPSSASPSYLPFVTTEDEKERFRGVLTQFLLDSAERREELKEKRKEMDAEVQRTASWLGENPRTTPLAKLLEIVIDLARNYDASVIWVAKPLRHAVV